MAPRDRVWSFLNDPEAISQCVPSLEQVELVDEEHFVATIRNDAGPGKGRHTFRGTWLLREAPAHTRLQADGAIGKSAVRVLSDTELVEIGSGQTSVRWQVEITVGGLLGILASRLLAGGRGDRFVSPFFECLRAKIEAGR